MTRAVDFTAYNLPSMAVACPNCGAKVGGYCKRPSGHSGPMVPLHAERGAAADRIHEAQGGGWISRTPEGGWVLVPLDADRRLIPPALAQAIAEEERAAAAASARTTARNPPSPPATRQGALF